MSRDLSVAVRYSAEAARSARWGVHYRVYRDGQPPKRRTKYFTTQVAAERYRDDLVAGYTRASRTPTIEDAGPTAKGTVEWYLKRWWSTSIKAHKSAATARSYESMIRNHIIKAPLDGGGLFGGLQMADLRPLVIRELYEGLYTRGVPLPTRQKVHVCLSSACTTALQDEVLDRHPCLTLGRKLRHKDEDALGPSPNPFTAAEMDAFMSHVRIHEPEWTEYFQFLFDTGVRVGEAAALKWDTVDLKGRRAEIVASYSSAEKGDKEPKTRHSRRWIVLTDLVCQQLADWRKRQRVEALARGLTPRVYVFTLKNGNPRRQNDTVRPVFTRICAAIKAPGHTPHDCRDTFASTHLSADYRNLPRVSKQLGHADTQTTVRHYFRYMPSEQDGESWVNTIRSGSNRAAR